MTRHLPKTVNRIAIFGAAVSVLLWRVPAQRVRGEGEMDGVTGLPADVTPLLSIAGTWQPVDDQYVSGDCHGTLANVFTGNFSTDSSGREHVIATGWQYCGFTRAATATTPVHLGMFRQTERRHHAA